MIEQPVVFGSKTLNDGTKADLSVSPNYWIPIVSVEGLFGDEIQAETHPNPCGPGETHGEVTRNGKQLIMSGRIYGLNLAAMREGQLLLMEAFYDLQEHQLKFYFSPEFGQLYITAYCNQPLVIQDQWNDPNGNWRQDWQVGLRADDPTIYKVADDTKFQTWM